MIRRSVLVAALFIFALSLFVGFHEFRFKRFYSVAPLASYVLSTITWRDKVCKVHQNDTEANTIKLRNFNSTSEDNIFFIETSCTSELSAKQACSIETAAHSSPNRKIIVGLTSAVRKNSLLFEAILSYPNVEVVFINPDSIFPGTVLEDFHKQLIWSTKTKWPVIKLADSMRLALVCKYGGTYSDIDYLFLRKIPVGNWIAQSQCNSSNYGNGIFSFVKNNLFCLELMKYIKENYDGSIYGSIGPKAFTEMYSKHCITNETICEDITVYEWSNIFEPNRGKKWINILKKNNAIGVHFFNYLSKNKPLKPRDGSLMDVIARNFCPSVYSVLQKH